MDCAPRSLLRIFWIVLVVTLSFAPSAQASSQEKVLYSFSGGADGGNPVAKLIFDKAGNLYGTTSNGGAYNAGTVFMLKPSLARSTETVLYSFTGGADGGYPLADLVFDSTGNLYGTAAYGGTYGNGVVFELSPISGGGWTQAVLHSFDGAANDGVSPSSHVTFDKYGNLYGTTVNGGVSGTVFELTFSGGTWTEIVLLNIAGNTSAGLAIDKADNLYGTTVDGGTGSGSVFEVLQSTPGLIYGDLYDFTGGSDGGSPNYGTVLLHDSKIYGTTAFGGTNGCGVVFELNGSPVGQSVIYSFACGNDGADPLSSLVSDRQGNFYGTTHEGGTSGYGTVFELSPNSGGGWTETVLHSFTGWADGAYPIAGVTLDGAGRLYGTTEYGGKSNAGVIFAVKP